MVHMDSLVYTVTFVTEEGRNFKEAWVSALKNLFHWASLANKRTLPMSSSCMRTSATSPHPLSSALTTQRAAACLQFES